ncbi:MAG: hypothetical protein JKY89_03945 [Immundisolibacteraceae bacterium]|nr:hypothetical protein [Immundisolibacteraceae bacterium]
MDNHSVQNTVSITEAKASGGADSNAASGNNGKALKPTRGLLKPVLLLLMVAMIATGWGFQVELQSWLQARGFFQEQARLAHLEQQLRQSDQQFKLISDQLAVHRERLLQAEQFGSQLTPVNESLGGLEKRIDQIELGLKRQQSGAQVLAVRQLLFVAEQQLRLVNDRSLALQA